MNLGTEYNMLLNKVMQKYGCFCFISVKCISSEMLWFSGHRVISFLQINKPQFCPWFMKITVFRSDCTDSIKVNLFIEVPRPQLPPTTASRPMGCWRSLAELASYSAEMVQWFLSFFVPRYRFESQFGMLLWMSFPRRPSCGEC